MGKKITENDIAELISRVETLEKKLGVTHIPKGLKIGDEFELADINWKILDITDAGYMCIGDSLGDKKFDENSSDWNESSLREYLNNEFYEKIAREVGRENIISSKRNLLSLDGQTEYGESDDFVSLLTVDEYRKYRKLIPNTGDWWWLVTPWSTPCNEYSKTVTVVSPSGYFSSNGCYDSGGGVRPFCIFSSSIFESEE
jgi:hypothetical protein